MLSIEKPPPAPLLTDLPCNTSNNNTNNTNTDDDHDHDKLSQNTNKPELDHNLPNFSIRDYVFTARGKDIKNNWPFSVKNLQVCQNHGVKDVLPPFEPRDSVRKRCSKRRRLQTFSIEKRNVASSDKEPSGKGNHVVAQERSCDGKVNNDKQAVSCVDISSCRSGQENEFVSTTTSVSQFEIDSVPDNVQSSSQITETETLLKASAEVGAAAPPQVNNKTGNNSRPSGKRCRLIVKFGGSSDHSSNEDITNNCPTVSEAMASKVCPVCKIFSSSSNTTLNAHIDQCLATESAPSDSKPTRYRIKPRKYRFMVDIYATAKSCTLEELDRRNGTTWSVVSTTLPSQESGKIETSREEKKRMLSVNHPVDVDDVGLVYIDENGTKLRILSRSNNHPQESDVRENTGEIGESKGGKVNNHILKKKKKRLVQRHLSSLSHKPHNSRISGGVEGNNGEEKRPEKVHQMTKQIKPSDSGALRPWVCSKKRGITKKVTGQGGHRPVKCRWHLPQDLLVDHNHQSFSETPTERNNSQKKLNVSEMLVRKGQAREKMVSSSGGKRMTCSMEKGICDKMKTSFLPMKRNSNQLSKDGTSIQDSWMLKSPESTRSRTYKKSDQSIHGTEVSIVAPKSLRSSQAAVTKAKSTSCYNKVMPSRNKLASVSVAAVGKTKKLSTFNTCQVQSMRKRDDDLDACHSKVDRRYDFDTDSESQSESEETADVSFEGDSSLETRQDRGMRCTSQMEEGLSLQNSKSTVHDSHHNVVVNAVGFSVVDGDSCEGESAKKQVGLHAEDMVSELSSKTSDELLCGTEVPTNMAGTDFVDDQDLFPMDVGDGMIGQNGDMGVELDSGAPLGSSFPEVDPIPIPGPPGSFLPSPRDMCSEDFQGNSSLTTSRVQSSPDRQEIAEADLSDSPISAASTISNSTAGGSNSNHKQSQSQPPSSTAPSSLQNSLLPGFTAATTDTSVQQGGGAQFPLTKGTEVERSIFDVGVVKLDKISMEKGSLSFKNDQPCCCQRKSAALNNQESQLLRRRKMALPTVPPSGKQTSGNSQPRSTNLDSRFELVPPSTIPTSVSDNMVVPVIKPSTCSIPSKDSSISGVRVLARADSDSASPSASNPVLRLMGKNLMVVNKDGDASMPMGLVQPHAKTDHQASSLPTFPNGSQTNIMNQDYNKITSQDSLVFGQDPCNTASPYFDPRFAQNFRSHSDSIFPQAPNQQSTVAFRDQQTDGGFAMPMKLLNFKSDSIVSSRHNSLKNTVNTLGSFRMGNGVEPPDCLCKHADPSINSTKEIIVIDDAPEGKPTVINEATRHAEVWKQNPLFTSGIATPMNYKSGSVRAFYQSQEPVRESVSCSSTPVTPNRLLETSSKGWGCTTDGPKMVPRSPFVAASSSNGLLRSTPALYHSPGFL